MNGFKTAALMAVMMVLFLFVGNLLGGQAGMTIAFVFSLLLNFGSYWFSDKIVLSMYRAKEVSRAEYPVLYRIVENLASKANLPMPKVYVIDSQTPNAFATGRNPEHSAVAVTTGIMNILSEDELEGVIAHELTHIKNRDILVGTIAATLVGTITLIARMAGWAAMFGGSRNDDRDGNIFYELALIIIAPIAAMLIQLAISRSREFMADEGGALISGNPMGLASALDKLSKANEVIPMRTAKESTAHMFIVSPLSGKSFAKLFSTHPPIEERIKRLKEIADGRR
ncbi:Heat shock protein HtpX [Melioribacter roseus P3M-2]|uniref:Protease HtpX homolog n=1 Tax=Melioribacter roseus (strain DSM 23840 / JCM 17771 / VKM B-2668 / P3M-2) TaxID=1191523 RepID=I6YW90_MELRP|nr:zinc metalloprotease HtpX [Melioribacter roseus]AFN74852.1 Heat shock protein HtpX [Melioribacter roseus P3M-2]